MDSLQSGTSASPSTCRASVTVSITGRSGQRSPQARQAATRKLRSNGALCAASTAPSAKARKPGSTAWMSGASATIASLIPVSAAMSAGIA